MTQVSNSDDSSFRGAVRVELQNIEEDSEYSAARHYIASDNWHQVNLWLSIPNAIIAGLASISAFQQQPILTAILAAMAAILAALTAVLNPSDRASNHKQCGCAYHALRNRCRILRTVTMPRIATEDIHMKFEELAERRDELNSSSPQTSRRAFERARKGIEEGELTYKTEENRNGRK